MVEPIHGLWNVVQLRRGSCRWRDTGVAVFIARLILAIFAAFAAAQLTRLGLERGLGVTVGSSAFLAGWMAHLVFNQVRGADVPLWEKR